MNEPLVTVIVRTYNQPKSILDACLGSIVNQTYKNWEFLISDDSTSEESVRVIDDHASGDKRIRVVRRPARMGLVGSLNVAIRESKGDYLAILDADDIAVPERLQLQVDYFESHEKCDVLGGAMNIINEQSEKTSVRYYPTRGLRLLFWMMLRDAVGHPTVMFRRKVFDDGFFYDESMSKGCEDTEMWLRLRNHGYVICNLKTPLVNYRIAEDMAIKRKADNKANFMARKKNFSYKYFVFDCISLFIMWIRMFIPQSIVSWAYSKENNQKY